MGSGASKDSKPEEKDIKEEQMINTDEYEPIKNWQGENVGLRQRTDSEKMRRRLLRKAEASANANGSQRSSKTGSSSLDGLDSASSLGKSSLHSGTSSTFIQPSAKKWERVKRSYRPIQYPEEKPTIEAAKKWNSKSAADALDKAMDGVGTDERTIIDVLTSCNSKQRSELKKTFKSRTKEDLLLVVRQELSGNFLELVLVLLRDPLAFDIDLINIFLKEEKRWPTLVGFLVEKTSTELSAIEEKFKSLFGQTIQDQIKRETRNSKSDFGHVLLSIFLRSNYRKEAGGGEDTDDARATANMLMGETEDGDHFKDALLQFLEINEHEEIRETCEAIRQMYQVDLIDVIDQVFEDEQDKGEPFKAAVAACDDTAYFFAGCIHDAFREKDEDWLMRIVAGRSEIDLRDIEAAYKESFREDLAKSISRKTSGDYKHLLLSILN